MVVATPGAVASAVTSPPCGPDVVQTASTRPRSPTRIASEAITTASHARSPRSELTRIRSTFRRAVEGGVGGGSVADDAHAAAVGTKTVVPRADRRAGAGRAGAHAARVERRAAPDRAVADRAAAELVEA